MVVWWLARCLLLTLPLQENFFFFLREGGRRIHIAGARLVLVAEDIAEEAAGGLRGARGGGVRLTAGGRKGFGALFVGERDAEMRRSREKKEWDHKVCAEGLIPNPRARSSGV